jgi:hypothetical protein
MKAVLFTICLVSAAFLGAETWTNRSGRVFSARLIAVSDNGAVFVFPEDGATNVLALSKLSKGSAQRVCDRFDFAPLPPRLAATFNRAVSDFKRIKDMQEDGLLTAEKAAERRAAVIKAFSDICRAKGIASEIINRLVIRLQYRKNG